MNTLNNNIKQYILNTYLLYNELPIIQQLINFEFNPLVHIKIKLKYHQNGLISEKITYLDRQIIKKEGWYNSSIKYFEINYKNKLRYGIYKIWYENGNLSKLKYYINGELNGNEFRFDSRGFRIFKAQYKNGELDGI